MWSMGMTTGAGPNIVDLPTDSSTGGYPSGCGSAYAQLPAGFSSEASVAAAPANGGLVDTQDVFEVTLSKDVARGGQRFGFANVPTQDGLALIVSWIEKASNGGLLDAWNSHNLGKAAREGDRIVAVNGVAGDVEAMRAQLQLDVVRMLVQKDDQHARPFER